MKLPGSSPQRPAPNLDCASPIGMLLVLVTDLSSWGLCLRLEDSASEFSISKGHCANCARVGRSLSDSSSRRVDGVLGACYVMNRSDKVFYSILESSAYYDLAGLPARLRDILPCFLCYSVIKDLG